MLLFRYLTLICPINYAIIICDGVDNLNSVKSSDLTRLIISRHSFRYAFFVRIYRSHYAECSMHCSISMFFTCCWSIVCCEGGDTRSRQSLNRQTHTYIHTHTHTTYTHTYYIQSSMTSFYFALLLLLWKSIMFSTLNCSFDHCDCCISRSY